MTISSEVRRAGPYAGDGATQVFPFDFKTYRAGDLLIVYTGASGDQELVLNSDYTVSLNPDQDGDPGGLVTCLIAPPAGSMLTIISDRAYLQNLKVHNAGGFYPENFNDAFDNLEIQIQQLREEVERSPRGALSDVEWPRFPTAEERAGGLIGFDEDGNIIVPAINTVAGMASDIAIVAALQDEIQIVADADVDIGIVADNIDDVNTLADWIGTGGGVGNAEVIATGSSIERTLADRFGEYVNALDYLKGDGTAEDSVALLAAVTEAHDRGVPLVIPATENGYLFPSATLLPANSNLVIVGHGYPLIRMSNHVHWITSYSGTTISYINSLDVSGLYFEGQWVRPIDSYPYRDTGTFSMSVPINVIGNLNESSSFVRIRNCRFRNIRQQPFIVRNFSGHVDISGNEIWKTWDPGVIQCRNVHYYNNVLEFGTDTAGSITRSNINVHVHHNTIRHFERTALSLLGWDSGNLGSGGTLTVSEISGGGYLKGAVMLATLAGSSGRFAEENVGQMIEWFSGSDSGHAQVIEVIDNDNARVVALIDIEAGVQNTPVSNYNYVSFGNIDVNVHDNIIVGCRDAIEVGRGFTKMAVYNNRLICNGVVADGEVNTTASGASGQADIVVADATYFDVNDWVMFDPPYNVGQMFFARINSKSGTTLTLSANLPFTYHEERLYKAHPEAGAFAISVSGKYRTADVLRHGEVGSIHGNTIVDYINKAIEVGQTGFAGSVKYVDVRDNKIILTGRSANALAGTTYAIHTQDRGGVGSMRNERVRIYDNEIIDLSAALTYAIYCVAMDSNAPSRVEIFGNKDWNNRGILCETSAAASLMESWYPQQFGQMFASKLNIREGGLLTIASGAVTVTSSMHRVDTEAAASSDDLDTINLGGTPPYDNMLLIIASQNSGRSVVVKHGTGNIRTRSGGDITLSNRTQRLMLLYDTTDNAWGEI